jgi:hypothetical protein
VRENFKDGPLGQGEVSRPGRCQLCGEVGPTLLLHGAPPPNELCPRCVLEQRDGLQGGAGADDEEYGS